MRVKNPACGKPIAQKPEKKLLDTSHLCTNLVLRRRNIFLALMKRSGTSQLPQVVDLIDF
jgi:hypothetical protein